MEKAALTGLVPLWEPQCLHIVLRLVSRLLSRPHSLWLTTSCPGTQIKKNPGEVFWTRNDNHMSVITALEKEIIAVSKKIAAINKSSWNECRLLQTLDVVKLFVKMHWKGNLTQ